MPVLRLGPNPVLTAKGKERSRHEGHGATSQSYRITDHSPRMAFPVDLQDLLVEVSWKLFKL